MKRLLAIVLLICGLTACSTKMSYHFIDWAIEWELDDYVSLNDAQDKQFDKLLDNFLAWHRTSELPKYSADLRQFRDQIANNTLTPQAWQSLISTMQQHWFHIFDYCFDDTWPIMQSLSDKQVASVNKQLDKEQQEMDKEYEGKTAKQLLEDANDRIEDLLDDWLGSVTKAQKQLVHQYNSEREFSTDMWLEYRHAWYQQFKQALEQRDNTALFQQQLKILLVSPQQLRSEEYRQKIERNSARFGALLVQVNASLSKKQKRHLLKKLDDMIEDLDELAAESD